MTGRVRRANQRVGKHSTRSSRRRLTLLLLIVSCFLLTGCSVNVGVGMSVGVPIGDHGYMRVGSHRWL